MSRNPKETTFHGVEALKKAADEGLLRQGQLIFGTVSIAHHEDVEGTVQGWLYNTLTPFIMKIMKRQMRKIAYLHTSVYAGKHEDGHYVIENGGADSHGVGTIDVSLIEDAFEMDALFFVVSPPKDSNGKSTRYLVVQRALACIGLQYIYNMRAVSCETFATALLGLMDENYFAPRRTHKPDRDQTEIDDQKARDIRRFKQFHKDLVEQINEVPDGTILSLKFYMAERKNQMFKTNSDDPWFFVMTEAYNQFEEAARRGDTEKCLVLLNMGLNPEGRSRTSSHSAAMTAARAGHWQTTTALVKEGADGGEVLVYAASKGYTQTCLDLMKLGVNGTGSAVKAAACEGHWQTTTALVKEGADGGEALVHAASEGLTQTCLDLLKLGVDGGKALFHAASQGLTQTCLDLHKLGVDGGKALVHAASEGHTKTCQDLMKLGVNDNGSAVEAAARADHWQTAVEMVKEGADPSKLKQRQLNDALLRAARDGHTEIVKTLLSLGAQLEHQDRVGNTALLWAAAKGHTETVKALVSLGAQLEHQNTYGYTALLWAAEEGHTETVKVLVSLGAQLEHQNTRGDTALSIARRFGRTETVTELQECTANMQSTNKSGNAEMKPSHVS